MELKEIAKKLNCLIQLDIDAVEAYAQALKNIDIKEVYDSIKQFSLDHERHIIELSQALRDLGEQPIERLLDIKGFFIEGFTAIRSATGTPGALKAMKMNEHLTNKTYNEALSYDFPTDVKQLVQKNYADEQRHLLYIEKTLASKPWEISENV